VRRIVEAHAGTITVENRPRGGALFRLSFAATAS
jgi:signal transduction histidine kinase